MNSWNGTCLLRQHHFEKPDVLLRSDASRGWGCGAFWLTLWFQVPWRDLPLPEGSIAAKELLPIVLAALVWGSAWQGSSVLCVCDNAAVVDVINHHSARDPLLCHLLRCLLCKREARL